MTPTDPSAEDHWCAERAVEVRACIARLGLAHGRVGDGPAWHVRPYASVWAVERADRPEWLGWWVICGDLPDDALPAHDLPTPRDAVRAFGKRWTLHAQSLDRGEVPPAWAHVPTEALPRLADTLRRRGAALQAWADEAASWPADEA